MPATSRRMLESEGHTLRDSYMTLARAGEEANLMRDGVGPVVIVPPIWFWKSFHLLSWALQGSKITRRTSKRSEQSKILTKRNIT